MSRSIQTLFALSMLLSVLGATPTFAARAGTGGGGGAFGGGASFGGGRAFGGGSAFGGGASFGGSTPFSAGTGFGGGTPFANTQNNPVATPFPTPQVMNSPLSNNNFFPFFGFPFGGFAGNGFYGYPYGWDNYPYGNGYPNPYPYYEPTQGVANYVPPAPPVIMGPMQVTPTNTSAVAVANGERLIFVNGIPFRTLEPMINTYKWGETTGVACKPCKPLARHTFARVEKRNRFSKYM